MSRLVRGVLYGMFLLLPDRDGDAFRPFGTRPINIRKALFVSFVTLAGLVIFVPTAHTGDSLQISRGATHLPNIRKCLLYVRGFGDVDFGGS